MGSTKGARLIDSTPPAIISSASPALMARAAVMTASMPEPQRRLIVVPGTLRQAGEQQRHARDIAVVLARLVGAAEDHIVDGVPVDGRVARHQRLQRDGAQIVGAHGGQRAAEAADGGADIVADEGFGHFGNSGATRSATGSSTTSWAPVIACSSSRLMPGSFSRSTKRPLLDVDDGEARIDAGDAADAGQRQRAALHQLGLAVLGDMVGDDRDALGAMHEIHGAADRRHAFRPGRQLARSPFSATS